MDQFEESTLLIPSNILLEGIVKCGNGINNVCEEYLFPEEVPVFVTVLTGGIYFTGQVMPMIKRKSIFSYVAVSRYGLRDKPSRVVPKILVPTPVSVENSVVFLLDDIFDQGYTINFLKDYFLRKGANRVISVCLLKKNLEESLDQEGPDIWGVECPDYFVFGCGLDNYGYYRNLSSLYGRKIR